MWNLKASSKITQDKMRQKSYEIHKERLKSMKPKMHIESPYQPDFVYSKHKLNLSRKQRRVEIDKHNHILLQKMNSIKMEQYNVNKLRPEAQNLKTLNAHVKNTMNDQILSENKKICEKLLKTQSFYPTNKTLDKTNELEKICTNISVNARRAMSAKSLSRPKSGYSTVNSNYLREKSPNTYRFLSKFEEKRGSNFSSQKQLRPQSSPFYSSSKRRGQSGRNLKPQTAQQIF